MLASVVNSPNRVGVKMGQLPLDHIWMEALHLVEQSARHRTKAVGGHAATAKTDPLKREIDRIFAHWPITLALGWEQIPMGSGERTNILDQGHNLF